LKKKKNDCECEDINSKSVGHAFHNHELPITEASPYLPYILTIGLSFHSIFEGLALGIEPTLLGTGLILIAIVLHKWAEAFAMGIKFLKNDVRTTKWISIMIVFSLIAPIGIVIGILLTFYDPGALNIIQGVLGAIAVGAFLYVGILGVMVEEFSNSENLFSRVLLFTIGLTLISLLSLLD